ncbi:MAG: RsmF rRNA methyltransferase first C-terminal domain-containing protein [Clostridia bacterium]|nr:RsmF rRNA methyltransferase first C-terminal domain-containing protein [Clostridia bacterium]
MNLPQAFIDRMAAQLGNELPAFLSSYDEPYARGIRFNPFKITKEAFEAVLGSDLQACVPWEPTGRYLSLESRAGASVLHEAGAWYLQEPSAMIPAAVLAPEPGEHVLDLCAAPGGKSTQLGLRMAGKGLLVCNEPVPDRARILSRNIERMGIPNALVVNEYPDKLARVFEGSFDAIQVDAPCSGEGMFRRHPETRGEWTPEAPAGCAKRQAEILDSAAGMLRSGGRMVYSTCTLNPIENEETVNAFLQRHPEFVLVPFVLPELSAPDGMLTIYPHRVRGEGHFVALLKKRGEGKPTLRSFGNRTCMPDKASKALLNGFAAGLEANLAFTSVRNSETLLCCLPEAPDWGRLNPLRRGLHLGQAKGKIFVPDHALAVSICPPDVPRIALTEEQARQYQSGQTIPADGKGWVLACYEGVALGWGKVSDGVMKNHYPKGLRR